MACLKSILSEKTALKGNETVVLTEECSVLVQKKLPLKLLDPGSFLILCTIGTNTFEKVLCDLGSSINLMPLSMMMKLGIQEAQPTRVSLEMADKSLERAYGVVENVLVKVKGLYLLADYKGGTSMQSSVVKPSHSVKSHTVTPDIKPNFGVGHSLTTNDGGGPKKKVPKDLRKKKIPTY
ncbi:uncharacterized protein LOC107611244 [Arachis ipaensis]|uniref:uncharacterized protein LOC107611244 n=1 Tax=Arachis ipaensis TaxID=130454 RepID=UPI0007AF5789|nr:uncharacterized protein LOC107611244 [Arachis ipaensis]